MKFNIPNFISGIIVTVLGLFFLILSFGIKTNSNDIFNASFMPKVYTTLIILFGISIIINSFKDKINHQTLKEYKGPILTMLLVTIYVIVIPILGYYLSTIIMIFAFLFIVKFENRVLLVLTPFIASALIYAVFEILLQVPIPKGSLF
ncbi:tripartite tricarboxylate transporter TctB family protein [Salinicoccus halodurans]|uniref:Tripartite tricarboxylate transporter TctB family protein n=1 Tax=Salinicoccus halodurans TaxID=407035 RepID=A0A0F7HLT3_9STAP|nr:tripartite tricarboxylate transporter TctB family protein [Salinicoccus halodurans]AKG75008.1 hypothetical protein AAT16_12935 [Salinicoccus halodurans]SFK66986.1 Tripartite tricarboxylate transporter TctB family protein [Salinicoccus halodurans]